MRKIGIVLFMMGILSLLGLPVEAASGNITYAVYCLESDEVLVTFTATGTVDDGNGMDKVLLGIYDDSEAIASEFFDIPVGEQRTYKRRYFVGSEFGQDVDGIDVGLIDNDEEGFRIAIDVVLYDELGEVTTCPESSDIEPIGGGVEATEELPPTCYTLFDFASAEPAPIDGTLRFYILGGYEKIIPEGHLITSIPTVQGEVTEAQIQVECGMHIRAWLYDGAGNVVALVPSQYENGDGVFEGFTEDYGAVEGDNPLYVGFYSNMIYPGEGLGGGPVTTGSAEDSSSSGAAPIGAPGAPVPPSAPNIGASSDVPMGGGGAVPPDNGGFNPPTMPFGSGSNDSNPEPVAPTDSGNEPSEPMPPGGSPYAPPSIPGG